TWRRAASSASTMVAVSSFSRSLGARGDPEDASSSNIWLQRRWSLAVMRQPASLMIIRTSPPGVEARNQISLVLKWWIFRPPVDGLAAAPGLVARYQAARVVQEPPAAPRTAMRVKALAYHDRP